MDLHKNAIIDVLVLVLEILKWVMERGVSANFKQENLQHGSWRSVVISSSYLYHTFEIVSIHKQYKHSLSQKFLYYFFNTGEYT